MTAQEYYDMLCVSAFDGTFPSVAPDPLHPGEYRCKYRGDNGAKCAVGILISEERYTPALEGKTIDELRYHYAPITPSELPGDLLGDAQYEHDCAALDIPTLQPQWNPGEFLGRINEIEGFANVRKIKGKPQP